MNDDLQHSTTKARGEVSDDYWQLFYSIMNEDVCPRLEEAEGYFDSVREC